MTSEQGNPEKLGATASGTSDDVSAPVDFTVRAKLPFPVVGVGASAGGVDALRGFFSASSPASGIAYVVIQHLSPDHSSLMAEILGRCTTMPVHQIEDGVRIEPNHIYVIRPGYTVTLEGGVLRLGAPVELRGHRRPVDDFFRSLAREQQESAIAVVLSGTGTNGTAGAQAIKAVGGLCIAQDPQTTDFPGMPQSLIYAGYADQVLKVEDIPPVLLRYVRHPYLELNPQGRARAAQQLERHRQQLKDIIAIVRARTRHDFDPYKPPTVLRRIQRRMGLAGVATLEDYGSYLKAKPGEVEALANDLMINVTGFFRDPAAWEALREAVVRPMVEQRAPGDPIRAWVCACASGEEPYSLAMLIAEEAERAHKDVEVKIFATDTADKSLSLARAGVYPAGIEGDLSTARLERFFEKDEHTYRIQKALRDQVVFAPQDLLRDPPFSRLDIVTCRNLLIYLEPEAQRRALALLHFALRDGGHLLLGNSETLGQAEMFFEVVSKRWRIYRRTGPAQHRFAELPSVAVRMSEARPAVRSVPTTIARPASINLIQTALLAEFGPPTAVVDANDRMVYFHGDAEAYLHLPSGEMTQNLLEMVRPALRAAVRSALRQAAAEKRAITVEIDSQDGFAGLAITAAPLRQNHATGLYRVSFAHCARGNGMEASPGSLSAVRQLGGAQHDAALEEEVSTLRRELQATVEAFEATNEELKASNEEVTSTNEELQSTNEELETGKEELQSLNEELITVNATLQSKIVELEALTNDLDNLLSSTDIAVVFLDTHLNVRRFTAAVSDLLELIPADIGRPLAHFTQKFTAGAGDLISDAGRVLTKLAPLESEVHSHSGRWYLRRTLPYRTQDDHIAGVVITFVDITARKRAEQSIEAAQERLQTVIEQMPAAVLMVDASSGRLLLANRHAAMLFDQPFPLPFIGHSWVGAYSALRGFHADGRSYEPQEWPLARTLSTGEVVLDEELDFVRPNNTPATISMSASPVRNSAGDMVAAVAAFWDITERKVAQETLRDSEEHFRMLVESAHDYAIFMLDQHGDVVSWNQGAERVTGYSEQEILGQAGAILFTPEDRAAGTPEEEMRGAAQSERPLDERWHLRKDGTRFWASGVMTAARDARGRLRGFVKIMRDQTDRKSMDAQLR
jgi:two-component system, chemotaxis family, CheB/CheR fusion protein